MIEFAKMNNLFIYKGSVGFSAERIRTNFLANPVTDKMAKLLELMF